MSNTISQPSPNMIDLHSQDVWQYPASAEMDPTNPAVQAREEFQQHQYIEALAGPAETVPATGEIHGYATNDGNVIDPAHSEAVIAAAQQSVADAFAADPDLLAMQQANEVQRLSREQHAAAVVQAGAYAPRIEDIRDCALINWGAEGEV